MTLLQVRELTASYGATQALFGVDLEVAAGEVVALMGRNGMGKTTTIKAICRMINCQGQLRFAGQDVMSFESHQVAKLGVGLVPEGRRCFSDLTVRENLLAAARQGEWTLGKVLALFPALADRLDQRAVSLSGGEQQMLVIGRALATNPKLLVLDEATEGLAPLIRKQIWAVIARLKAETGMAILLVDKSLEELRGISDRAVILERGTTVWSGKMGELTADVSSKYIGV